MITVDDDIFYPTSIIEELLKESLRYSCPVVVSRYSSAIMQNNLDNCLPYIKWKRLTNKSRDKVFFGSGGGALFPPGMLYKDVCSIGLFQRLAPLAGDIWLSVMYRLQGIKMIPAKERSAGLLPVIDLIDIALADKSIGNNSDDKQIKSVREYYLKKGIDLFAINNK